MQNLCPLFPKNEGVDSYATGGDMSSVQKKKTVNYFSRFSFFVFRSTVTTAATLFVFSVLWFGGHVLLSNANKDVTAYWFINKFASTNDKSPTAVAFPDQNDGLYYVAGGVEEIPMTHMLIDTGASFVVISNKFADKLGLTCDATGHLIVADGRHISGCGTVLKTLTIGDIRLFDVPVSFTETTSNDVTIGQSALSQLNIEVGRGVMHLTKL